MPALRAAKERAHMAMCMNNLHQIGLAVSLYGETYDAYPLAFSSVTFNYFWADLNRTLQVTNGTSKVFECPTNPGGSIGYGPNLRLFAWWQSASPNIYRPLLSSPQSYYPRKFPLTERPAEVMTVADSTSILYLEQSPEMWSYYTSATANTLVASPDYPLGISWRHMFGERANFLFADGHVETVTRDKFYARSLILSVP